MISWQYYPKSHSMPGHLQDIISVFKKHEDAIKSPENELASNKVLLVLREELVAKGYKVEDRTASISKIKVPVLFGRNGQLEKYFEADAFDSKTGTVLEVEAGRGVTNYQFLKDLFQACLMHDVSYLAIAVRNLYRNNADFEKVIAFFDALYASGRLSLPLKGILVIGY